MNLLCGFQQAAGLQQLHHLLGLLLVEGLPGVDVKGNAQPLEGDTVKASLKGGRKKHFLLYLL